MGKKVCNGMVIAILVVILGIFLLLFVPMIVGYTGYSMVSRSMEPEYPIGALVYKKVIPFEELKKGDVICFLLEEKTDSVVTHRITQIDYAKRWVKTKGDRNVYEDIEWVEAHQIIGRVEGSLPYLGFINLFFQTRAGKVAIIFIPVFLMFLTLLGNAFVCKNAEKGD